MSQPVGSFLSVDLDYLQAQAFNDQGETILTQDIGKFGSFGLEFTGLVPKNVNKLFKAGLDQNFFKDL